MAKIYFVSVFPVPITYLLWTAKQNYKQTQLAIWQAQLEPGGRLKNVKRVCDVQNGKEMGSGLTFCIERMNNALYMCVIEVAQVRRSKHWRSKVQDSSNT